jgi:hypothetical protein
MADLSQSLERMSFPQLLLLLGFVAAYMLAVGAMLGSRWRRRCAALAAGLAAGVAASTDPWVHGALLVVFVVAGLGLFVGTSWLLARLLVPREPAPEPAPAGDTAPAVPSAGPATEAPVDSQLPALRPSKPPKLAARRAAP